MTTRPLYFLVQMWKANLFFVRESRTYAGGWNLRFPLQYPKAWLRFMWFSASDYFKVPHKPTLTLRVVSAALLLSVACLSGCATGKEDAGGAAVVVGMGTMRMARMAGATVNVAAVLYLSKHRDARPLFVAAEHALALLRGNTNAMPADLALALAELPMLRDGNGAVFVSALTPLVWNEMRQMVTAIERQAGLQEFIRSLDDALISALLFTAS